MPASVSTPVRRISSTTTFVVALAFARLTVLAARALAAVSALPAVPSLVPRALAAASAERVRSLILRASSSATAARMCRVSLDAKGWSQATKSTPASINAAMNDRLRASRSSFATSEVALPFLAASRALASSGRSDRLPDSISTYWPTITQPCCRTKASTAVRWASRPRPLSPWRTVDLVDQATGHGFAPSAQSRLAAPYAALSVPVCLVFYLTGSSALSTTYWPTFLPISVPTTVEKR
jgi:hypothetical protein